MKIEIGEDDGILHDGIPQIVILTVSNGTLKKTFPFPADKPISAIYKACAKALGFVNFTGPVLVEERQTVSNDESGFTVQSKLIDPSQIQKGDTIIYQGIPPEEDVADLIPGNSYQVLAVGKDTCDVQDIKAAVPYRLTIFKKDAVLAKKALPIPPRKEVYEALRNCLICRTEIVLERNESGLYLGSCDFCGQSMELTFEPSQEKTANAV